MMISLPAKWIRHHQLDKGDEVSLEEAGEELVIHTKETTKQEVKVKENLSGFHPLINRAIITHYVKGVDELELLFDNEEDQKRVKKRVIDDLIGFEVIKQTKNTIILRDITGTEKQDIDEITKRIFFILDSMIEELIEGIQKKQKLDHILEIDRSVNKFVHFCLRILNKKGHTDNNQTKDFYSIITRLEEVGDTTKKIAKSYSPKTKITEEEVKALKAIRHSLQLFKELLFSFDKQKAIAFAKNYESINKKIQNNNTLDAFIFQLNETIIRMNNHLLEIALT